MIKYLAKYTLSKPNFGEGILIVCGIITCKLNLRKVAIHTRGEDVGSGFLSFR